MNASDKIPATVKLIIYAGDKIKICNVMSSNDACYEEAGICLNLVPRTLPLLPLFIPFHSSHICNSTGRP